jgi:hypothetical protein
MIDLGDVVPLVVNVTNAAGVAADATTVTVTLTLPDSTTTGPFTVTSTPAGTYTYNYTPSQAGRHSVEWAATGTNASAFGDTFDVRDSTDRGIVSLAETKSFLQISATNTTNDDQLRWFIASASAMWNRRIGPVSGNMSFDERYDGGGPRVTLRNIPVVSITAVVEAYSSAFYKTLTQNEPDSGSAGGPWDYTIDLLTGTLTRRAVGVPVSFAGGQRNIHVTYKAGYTVVPYDIQHAVMLLTQHLWETQRGRMILPNSQPSGDSWNPAMSFTWPKRVLEIAQSYYVPGIG